MPIALVIGDVSLVRCLGRAGVSVTPVVQAPRDSVAFSRYSRGTLVAPSFVDAPEAATEALAQFGARQSDPPILFYQGDHDLLAVSRRRSPLGRYFRFVLPEPALVEALV